MEELTLWESTQLVGCLQKWPIRPKWRNNTGTLKIDSVGNYFYPFLELKGIVS